MNTVNSSFSSWLLTKLVVVVDKFNLAKGDIFVCSVDFFKMLNYSIFAFSEGQRPSDDTVVSTPGNKFFVAESPGYQLEMCHPLSTSERAPDKYESAISQIVATFASRC